MRNWYETHFYVAKHAKVRENVLLSRLISTVTVILFCLFSISFAAVAYFSHTVSSERQLLQSANFETIVSITDSHAQPIEVVTSNYKLHHAVLHPDVTYTITVRPTERSSAQTGFCVLTAENASLRYHTQQLGVDGDTVTDHLTLYVRVSAETKLVLLSHWGTSSYYGYEESPSPLYLSHEQTVEIPIQVTTTVPAPTTTTTTTATTTAQTTTGVTTTTTAVTTATTITTTTTTTTATTVATTTSTTTTTSANVEEPTTPVTETTTTQETESTIQE